MCVTVHQSEELFFLVKSSYVPPFSIATGPLEDYFQKGALLGQKAALTLWYVDTRPI